MDYICQDNITKSLKSTFVMPFFSISRRTLSLFKAQLLVKSSKRFKIQSMTILLFAKKDATEL